MYLYDHSISSLSSTFVINSKHFLKNFFRPISQAITTEATEEIAQKNSGIETAICYEIFSRIEPLLERICVNPKCKRPFLIQRSTKTYCSTRCAGYVRNKEWKVKNKKISAKSVESKTRGKSNAKRKKE